ncbi:MAG: RAMP superfamily CRISPR-associated protein [Nitrospirota bacterium]|nr:RAMP superfamily CRISPR-associated protein [Nitrospirota bacterium]
MKMFINPYNFAGIDEENVAREEAVRYGGKSGVLTVKLTFLTDALVGDGNRKFMKVGGRTGIYGSSLKGLLRATAEAISNSCISMISGDLSGSLDNILIEKCDKDHGLCVACRIFGTTVKSYKINDEEETFSFAGKIKVMDAVSIDTNDTKKMTREVYLKNEHSLSSPNPLRHRIFYFDNNKIKGRKFYYHHKKANLPTTGEIRIEVVPEASEFEFEIQYNSLTDKELGLLLQSIELENDLGHKLGMGKPLGLGSCEMRIIRLKELNSKDRYSSLGSAKVFEGEALEKHIQGLTKSYENGKALALSRNLKLKDLLRLDKSRNNNGSPGPLQIKYPGQKWFSANKNVPLPSDGILDRPRTPPTKKTEKLQGKAKATVVEVKEFGTVLNLPDNKKGYLSKDKYESKGIELKRGQSLEVIVGEFSDNSKMYICNL